MKVLFVSAVLPYPLRSGGQIRIYNILKRLAVTHEVTLCSFIRRTEELHYAKDLSFCRSVYMIHRGSAWQPQYLFRAVTGKYPFLLSTYTNSAMESLLQGLVSKEHHNLVHIEPFYVWPSIPKIDIPLVVGEHNIEYEVYTQYVKQFSIVPLRPLLGLDVVKLRFWEESVWRKASTIIAVSEHDKRIMEKKNSKVTLVPNGVDIGQFPFEEHRPQRSGPIILFVGDFRWFPNQRAVRDLFYHVWPGLKQALPESRLRIIGRNFSADIREAKSQDVEIVSDVADIAREYRNADVLVAPMSIAGGTKFKILEAMASGLPVITTKEGVEGLRAENNIHYLEAKTPREFVDRVGKIWENKRLRVTLINNARKLIEEKYNWDAIAKTLDTVWRQTHENSH